MSTSEDVLCETEEYIDDLIRIVYKKDRLHEAKEIIKKSQEPLTPEQEKIAARISERIPAELEKADHQKAKENRKSKLLRILPKIMEIAACLIIVATVGTTIAIAKDESFRSAVMKLLINIDHEEGVANISFEENAEEAFDVPADWLGEYYPSRIPDGFAMIDLYSDEELSAVEYDSADGKKISFDENSYRVLSAQGIEEADTTEIMINDRLALLVSDDTPGEEFYRITWSNDEKWFRLETVHMTKEETLDLVKSVHKIIPKNSKKP